MAGKDYVSHAKEPANRAWALAVINVWRKYPGLNPGTEPIPLSYSGEQAEYFRRSRDPLQERMSIINTEVKNNSPEMTPELQLQLKAQSIAIEASIKYLLEQFPGKQHHSK